MTEGNKSRRRGELGKVAPPLPDPDRPSVDQSPTSAHTSETHRETPQGNRKELDGFGVNKMRDDSTRSQLFHIVESSTYCVGHIVGRDMSMVLLNHPNTAPSELCGNCRKAGAIVRRSSRWSLVASACDFINSFERKNRRRL